MQDEISNHMKEFNLAGFPGCIGSTDAAHVTVEKCSYRLRNNHPGAEQHLAMRSFNLTINHHPVFYPLPSACLANGMTKQWF
jgi:hypothetical protein